MATRMYEIQQKVFAQLNKDESLTSMVNGIYDYVPETTVCPYVTFGQVTSSSENTKTDDGERVSVTLDIWSESKGRKEAVLILQKIEEVMKPSIVPDTAFLISQKVTNREVYEETYGLYHATIEIEFLIEWEE